MQGLEELEGVHVLGRVSCGHEGLCRLIDVGGGVLCDGTDAQRP